MSSSDLSPMAQRLLDDLESEEAEERAADIAKMLDALDAEDDESVKPEPASFDGGARQTAQTFDLANETDPRRIREAVGKLPR
jgi:hypothetical protein